MTGPVAPPPPISEVLASLAGDGSLRDGVKVSDVLSAAGNRSHGLVILLLALPEMIPIPIPWLSTLLGVPLLMVSLHLAVFGDAVRLPASILHRSLPARVVAGFSRYALPPLRFAERWSRPRLRLIAERKRLVGLLCMLVSLVLFLPIPFLNGAPALTLILLAWGLIQKDGIFVLLGTASAILMVGSAIFLGGAITVLLAGLIETLGFD